MHIERNIVNYLANARYRQTRIEPGWLVPRIAETMRAERPLVRSRILLWPTIMTNVTDEPRDDAWHDLFILPKASDVP
jgi:hypothetical protein